MLSSAFSYHRNGFDIFLHDTLAETIRSFDLIAPDGKYYRLEADGTWVLYDVPVVEKVDEELTAEEALEIILGGAV